MCVTVATCDFGTKGNLLFYCEKCAPTDFAFPGHSDCVNDPADCGNSYYGKVDNTFYQCEICNQFITEDYLNCLSECPDQYKGNVATHLCELCPSRVSGPGHLSCLPCIAGKYLDFDELTCVSDCGKSNWGNSYTGKCEVCPDGTYSKLDHSSCVSKLDCGYNIIGKDK